MERGGQNGGAPWTLGGARTVSCGPGHEVSGGVSLLAMVYRDGQRLKDQDHLSVRTSIG